MRKIAPTFAFTVTFLCLVKSLLMIPKIDNSIVSKSYQSLDDKNVYNAFRIRVKFNVYHSFCEMRKLDSIKLETADTHRRKKIKAVGKSS